MFAFNFAPRGWALCDGSLLSIAQNTALFSLIGTTYGGDGRTTFALPDLRGRLPVGQGSGPGLGSRQLGDRTGAETVTLTASNLPAHQHAFAVPASSGQPTITAPAGAVLAAGSGPRDARYSGEAPDVTLAASQTGAAGSSLPLSVLNPSLTVTFCIALEGIFPSRS